MKLFLGVADEIDLFGKWLDPGWLDVQDSTGAFLILLATRTAFSEMQILDRCNENDAEEMADHSASINCIGSISFSILVA